MSRNSVKGKALPKGWHEVKLGKVASVKTGPFGAQLHQHDYVKSDGTPIVTVEHLSESGLMHVNLPLVADHDKKRLSQFLVQEGDILFSRVGSVDRSSLVSKKEDGWLFSGRLLRVRPDNRIIDSRYLRYFFSVEKFKHHMRSIAVGGTMPSLNTAILSNVKVSYPAIFQQRKIAGLLNEWDTAIEKTERLIAEKEKRFKWLLKRLISDQQGNSKWRKVRLGEVCWIDKRTLSSKTPSDYFFDYISLSDIDRGRLLQTQKCKYSNAPSRARRIVAKGDVLLATVRPNLQGFYIFRNELKDCIVSTGFAVLSPQSNLLDSSYLYEMLFSQSMMSTYHAFNVGSNYPAINSSDIRKFKISLPPLPVQERIAACLNAAQKEIDLLKQFAKQCSTQKRGLIQRLLTEKWLGNKATRDNIQ